MKLFLKLKLFYCLLVYSFSTSAQTIDTFTNTILLKDNYQIQFPKTWRVDSSKTLGVDLFLFSPLEGESDKFSENVNILTQDLKGQNIDLNKYKQITEDQLKGSPITEKDYLSIIYKEKNKTYYRVSYRMSQGQLKVKITSFCFIRDEKAYLVTFSCEHDNYELYRHTGEEILNTFRFIH